MFCGLKLALEPRWSWEVARFAPLITHKPLFSYYYTVSPIFAYL